LSDLLTQKTNSNDFVVFNMSVKNSMVQHLEYPISIILKVFHRQHLRTPW